MDRAACFYRLRCACVVQHTPQAVDGRAHNVRPCTRRRGILFGAYQFLRDSVGAASGRPRARAARPYEWERLEAVADVSLSPQAASRIPNCTPWAKLRKLAWSSRSKMG